MSFTNLTETLPEFAKDIKLNINSLFTNIATSGLTEAQFYGSGLAVALAIKNELIVSALSAEIRETGLDFEAIKKGAQTAANIMAMNNIYYRAVHLAEDQELTGMPANLRMNGMLNSGVDKVDFELFALAVSAINGCGMCIHSHVKQLVKHNMDKQGIQTALRLAAILQALDMALYTAKLT